MTDVGLELSSLCFCSEYFAVKTDFFCICMMHYVIWKDILLGSCFCGDAGCTIKSSNIKRRDWEGDKGERFMG